MTCPFQIGDWRADPSLRTLRRAGVEAHIELKHMQVLALLAEQRGRVVTKERLLQDVWADTFVGDEVLSRAISELRRVLGDSAKSPTFIQTIPKGGYRLIAPVVLDPADRGEVEGIAPLAPVPGVRARWFAPVTMALAIAAVCTSWAVLWRRPNPPATAAAASCTCCRATASARR